MTPNNPKTFQNPVLSGFHPDPSVCRVGGDFYLAVSSFTYFPGVPLFHSRDLVNWRPVGHALTRPSQFPPAAQEHSEGIFAPTLRHDGRQFWLITTNVGGGGNFLVTAPSIEGPWSDPVFVDAPGIDPSLYFEDGRVWVTGTASVPEGARYFGNNEVWLQELDPASMTLKGPRTGLWRGALRDAVWPEGPHLYFRDGWYYLLISEAGTGIHHAVTVARSRTIEGPYEGNRANPILTHRHLGAGQAVVNTGHADLVETLDGECWMVLLASRPHGAGTNRGRETFLAPVVWEDGWPVVSPGSGRLEAAYVRPRLPWTPWPGQDRSGAFDGFDAPSLGVLWSFLRTPAAEVHSLAARPGWLRLKGTSEGPGTRGTQAWVGRRVAHERWCLSTRLELTGAVRAGLAVVQSDDFSVRVEVGAEVSVVTRVEGLETRHTLAGGAGWLDISADGHHLTFRRSEDGALWDVVAVVDGGFLTTERAGGFVGCLAGPFAVGGDADFDWVDYRGHD